MKPTATATIGILGIGKINDFGQKIGGAKKDLASRAIDQISLITDDALVRQPLSKSFPRPDFVTMYRDKVITKQNAHRLQYLYNKINTKPRGAGIKRWADKTMIIIQTIKAGLDNEQLLDGLPFLTEKDYLNFCKEMEAANWPEEDYNPRSYNIHYPYDCSSDKRIKVVKDCYIKFQSLDLKECVDWIKQNTTTARKAAPIQFSIYSSRAKDKYYITPKGKSGISLKIFPTFKEAAIFRESNYDELVRIYKELRTIPEERNDWNRPRIGEEFRDGDDISPEQFSETFPFRGVEFGNWVTQIERAACLNEAYDALRDLASIVGVEPDVITLGNQLALAFGARGSGNASAHYERVKRVINLTKTRGAGSLAHEWFHALDNYLCIREEQSLLFATESPSTVKDDAISAITELLAAIKSSGFYTRSQEIDKFKSKPYWATMVELTARAFEKYVITRLAQKGHVNDYLANIKTFAEYPRPDIYPYPTDSEILRIAPSYDKLLKAIFQQNQLKHTA